MRMLTAVPISARKRTTNPTRRAGRKSGSFSSHHLLQPRLAGVSRRQRQLVVPRRTARINVTSVVGAWNGTVRFKPEVRWTRARWNERPAEWDSRIPVKAGRCRVSHALAWRAAGVSGIRARALRRSNCSSVKSQARLELQLARSGSGAARRKMLKRGKLKC